MESDVQALEVKRPDQVPSERSIRRMLKLASLAFFLKNLPS